MEDPGFFTNQKIAITHVQISRWRSIQTESSASATRIRKAQRTASNGRRPLLPTPHRQAQRDAVTYQLPKKRKKAILVPVGKNDLVMREINLKRDATPIKVSHRAGYNRSKRPPTKKRRVQINLPKPNKQDVMEVDSDSSSTSSN